MFVQVSMALLEGFGESLKVFLLTLLIALPLGLLISFGSMSKFSPLKAVCRGLVWIIRGTPLMLQLIIIFYGPGLIFDLPHCYHCRVCSKLCLLFLRDLSRWYRIHIQGAV